PRPGCLHEPGDNSLVLPVISGTNQGLKLTGAGQPWRSAKEAGIRRLRARGGWTMGLRERVIEFGTQELRDQVGLKLQAKRTLAYFTASTGKSFTKDAASSISWCTYFVHWVLQQAGVRPLPIIGFVGALPAMKPPPVHAGDPALPERPAYQGFVRALGGDDDWTIINPWTGQPEYVPAPTMSSVSRFMKHLGGAYQCHIVQGSQ